MNAVTPEISSPSKLSTFSANGLYGNRGRKTMFADKLNKIAQSRCRFYLAPPPVIAAWIPNAIGVVGVIILLIRFRRSAI